MKKIIGFSLIVLLSTALVAKGTIKFKKELIDFGEIESGKTVELNFEFENTGDTPLTIKNIETSCGCTTTQLEKKVYKPAEKGVIPVKFFSGGYSGKVTKSITVTSDDPDNPYKRLTLSGTAILKDFAKPILKPDRINFGKVEAGKTYTQKLNIANIGNIDLVLHKVAHRPEINLIFSAVTINPKKNSECEIIFKALEKGYFSDFVEITTNDPRGLQLVVKIDAEVE